MLYVVESDPGFLRFGKNRARNKTGSIIAFEVDVAEFKITHSGGADAHEDWSVDSVFSD
jgi:hypothetical protein